jgi:hypothetical protein
MGIFEMPQVQVHSQSSGCVPEDLIGSHAGQLESVHHVLHLWARPRHFHLSENPLKSKAA